MNTLQYTGCIIGVFFAALLFVQDLRARSIHVLALIGFSICGILSNLESSKSGRGLEILLNLSFIAFLVICILGFVWIREKSLSNLFEKIGLGDLFIFVSAALWMSFPMVLFLMISVNILLLSGVAILNFAGHWKQNSTIPLAGFMALAIIPTWFMDYFFIHSHDWLIYQP